MPGVGLVLTLFAVSLADHVPPDQQVIAEAEAAFREGTERRSHPNEARGYFQAAAEKYELLRRRGVTGAAINRNLGNAHLLAGDVPKAILAYRRALRFAGSDRRIQEALAYVRSRVDYPASGDLGRPPVDQRPPWLPRVWSGLYLAFSFLFYTLGWFAVRYWRQGRPGHWAVWSGVAFFITFLLIVALAAEEWRDADFINRPVVVLSEDGVLLRTGNGLSYPPRSEIPLNRGVEARLLFVRGDWLQIELGSGEIGWVPREYALVDESGGD
jgi:hypothetical protein